ncbi:MAG: heparinase, partial [Alphaproteobacteria bacterium]
PRDLRTADPSFAGEIYHGHFGLAGAVALTGTQSPFLIAPPSPAWERELHGFGWLRHLSAAGDEISREHARALVRDWITIYKKPRPPAWEVDLLARRIISWLSHSGIFLEGADQQFYEAVLESLTLQLRYLRVHYREARPGLPRLNALVALAFAELCTADTLSAQTTTGKLISEELDREILPDGGHISRNPLVLVEVLLDLLPLRQCYIARDQVPPKALVSAIDRMMPMIRFFRIGEGSLARFNGCGLTPTDNLAAVVAHDDILGAPVTMAADSGYYRMEAGETVLIADCGRPPPPAYSVCAHAGCLSFEMSVSGCSLIVNCGAPSRRDSDWMLAARSTAAHSTLILCDSSSSQMHEAGVNELGEDEFTLSGPANVTASPSHADGIHELRMTHDGYDGRYGVTHSRRLRLEGTGETLYGEDVLLAPHGLKGAARESNGPFAIRFHLHPSVSAVASEDGRTVQLRLRNGEAWQISAKEEHLAVEPGVYLADSRGPRRTLQVVIHGEFGTGTERRVNWIIEKAG